jgi:hypothetical protein
MCKDRHGRPKVKYLTRWFAKMIAKRNRRKTGLRILVYRCSACDGWHLTRVSE